MNEDERIFQERIAKARAIRNGITDLAVAELANQGHKITVHLLRAKLGLTRFVAQDAVARFNRIK